MRVVCPSGLTGEVRKLKIAEANILGDENAVRRGDMFDKVLAACWVSTEDFGPYGGVENRLDWKKVLVADRFALTVDIRVATYGPVYEYTVTCTNPTCRKKFPWRIDLTTDLERKPLPAESIAIFKAGNRFETRVEALGKSIFFKLQTGEDERVAAASLAKNQAKKMTAALAARIVQIEDVEPNDRVRFLDQLDMDEAMDIIDAMDAVDGGIETDGDVECSDCHTQQTISLPLGKEFWLPSRKKKSMDSGSLLTP